MRRRDMLRRTVAAGLGLSAGGLLEDRPGPGAIRGRVAPPPPGIPATLPATEATIAVWPYQPTTLQTYGGVYPSPILRARLGETVDVTLDNQLTEPTNIHWHGLTVPADMDGHPMDVIAPGASFRYTFPVLDRAGTYWYHPHPDMITASQVYRGMAGFFLVGDPEEDALGLPDGEFDVPLLLQDRRYVPDGSFTYAPTMMDLAGGYLGDVVLVNGVPDAQLKLKAAAYRFRFLNGSNARVFRLAFQDRRTFQVIAGDGGLLNRPWPASELFLSPGERAEIYVDLSRDAATPSLRLVSLPFSPYGTVRGHAHDPGGGVPQGDPMTVLRMTVGGTGPAPALPATLVPRGAPIGPAFQHRRFIMNMGMPPAHGNLTINGLAYDPARVDAHVERGTAEIWKVINASDHPHPFHVHATQFQVLSRSSRPLAPHERGRKDTVLVWPGEIVEILLRFDHYPGMYVFHCHNLEHEDAGMMATLMVM
jgi:FtsP/CotA-like multicopper oxidase with cupredoxin domain